MKQNVTESVSISRLESIKQGAVMIFKELYTERLILRNISSDDREFIFKQFRNDTVNQYLYDAEPLAKIEEADDIINFYLQPEPRAQHRWIVSTKEGQKIGTCGFHCWDKNNATCEIGYDLYPDFWKNGFMSEVFTEILDFAKRSMHVKKLNACIFWNNQDSIKLVEKFGFKYEEKTQILTFRGQEYIHRIYTLYL